ncbi:MAG: M10 family metallopeptidase C-terminal domain-containing protein, partial [Pseudomonadota bacterium]
TDAAVNLTGNGLSNGLNGNDSANTLTGLGGDDDLQGRAGADVINGGPGADLLRGGADADTFVFATGDATGTGDRILDFEVGTDTIDLSATGLTFGDLTITGTTNAAITYGAETITVLNASAAQLTEDQFDFGGS